MSKEIKPIGANLSDGRYYTIVDDKVYATPMPKKLTLIRKGGRYVASVYGFGDYPLLVNQVLIL